MAIREVREIGDEILGKQCKEVKKMTIRTKILIGDMLDTMYEKMGVRAWQHTGRNPQADRGDRCRRGTHRTDQPGDHRDFR